MPEEFGQLVPVGGGDPIPLRKRSLLIGRRGKCDIALNFPNVSSRHCQLEIRNGYWHVTDVGSTNGIKVNGARCEEKFLMPGDELTIAKHTYEVVYDADPSMPRPEEEEENIFAKSLMEKAGLERRRPNRPPSTRPPVSPSADTPPAIEVPKPKASPAKPKPASSGDSDDDRAFDFLNE